MSAVPQFSMAARASIVSLLLFVAFLAIWQLATSRDVQMQEELDEYALLMGKGEQKTDGLPTPAALGKVIWKHLSNPFYDAGANDKGIGIQLGYSLGRVALGFVLAAVVAIPLGFLIGMSPLMQLALNPYIQILKPISPLAWMPLALYTIKNSTTSSIFVIFICALWPMLINTAHGVASVKRDWVNVARTLEVRRLRTAFRVVLPAAAPTILTGMRISMGIAWLVIVAAEMLTGTPGVGGFLWQEYNSLIYSHILLAILTIGVVGFLLDRMMGMAEAKLRAF